MLNFSTGARSAMWKGGYQAAFQNGVLELRSGPQPTDADAADTGVLISRITLNGAPFTPGSPSNGLILADPSGAVIAKVPTDVWSGSAVAVGSIGHFRYRGNPVDSGAASTTAARLDGSVAVAGADLNISNVNCIVGTPTTVDQFRLTLPAHR